MNFLKRSKSICLLKQTELIFQPATQNLHQLTRKIRFLKQINLLNTTRRFTQSESRSSIPKSAVYIGSLAFGASLGLFSGFFISSDHGNNLLEDKPYSKEKSKRIVI